MPYQPGDEYIIVMDQMGRTVKRYRDRDEEWDYTATAHTPIVKSARISSGQTKSRRITLKAPVPPKPPPLTRAKKEPVVESRKKRAQRGRDLQRSVESAKRDVALANRLTALGTVVFIASVTGIFLFDFGIIGGGMVVLSWIFGVISLIGTMLVVFCQPTPRTTLRKRMHAHEDWLLEEMDDDVA